MLKEERKFLSKLLPEIDWFIAGGSVAASLNKSNVFEDIDVYFTSQEQLDHAINRLDRAFLRKEVVIHNTSDNAITFIYTSNKIWYNVSKLKVQFIKTLTGTIDKVINSFDFNKSKVALTPKGEIVKHSTFDKPLEATLENMSSSTFKRYFKYAAHKKFDENFETFDNFIDLIFNNFDKVFPPSYDFGPALTAEKGLVFLSQCMPRQFDQLRLLNRIEYHIKDWPIEEKRKLYKNVWYSYHNKLHKAPLESQVVVYLELKYNSYIDFKEYLVPNKILEAVIDLNKIKENYVEILL